MKGKQKRAYDRLLRMKQDVEAGWYGKDDDFSEESWHTDLTALDVVTILEQHRERAAMKAWVQQKMFPVVDESNRLSLAEKLRQKREKKISFGPRK